MKQKPIWTYAVIEKDYSFGAPISIMRFDIPFELQDKKIGDIEAIMFNPKKGDIAIRMKDKEDDFKKTDEIEKPRPEENDESFKNTE